MRLSNLAAKIYSKTIGEKNLDYASAISTMAAAFSGLGDFDKALYFDFEALAITEGIIGKSNLNYVRLLNQISTIYYSKGQYSSSFEFSSEGILILEGLNLETHPDYASILNLLALSQAKLGDYESAFTTITKSLDISAKNSGKNHPDYAFALNSKALIYYYKGEYSKSISTNFEALEIREKVFGKNHADCIMSINNIGLNYYFIGDYKNAKKFSLLAVDKYLEVFGSDNLLYALSLNNSALINMAAGNYNLSLEHASRCREIYERNGTISQSDYAVCLSNMVLIQVLLNRLDNASKLIQEAHSIYEKAFSINRFGLDPALVISSKKEVDNSFFVSCSLLSRDTSLSNFASRSWLNLNGIVGSEASNLESQIESSGDTALVHLMADLKLNKKQLAKYRELTKEEKTSRGIDEKALEDEVSRQERELSKQSKAFADFNRRFNLKDVSSVLKGDEVFVDIARVPYFSTYTNQWTDSVKYLVFIHDAKDSLVDYRFIYNGKELEGDVFSDYKIDCSNQANATDLKNALYYNSFWKPIADKIGSSKTVYVSLGGVYNNINLNTLYNPETGKYLVEEKDIRIVNNARDFILSKEQTQRTYTSTSTALYGFPDYNGNETITEDTTDYLALTRDLDPLWIDSLTRGGLKAAPLPATKVEVEQIAKSFKENGWQVSEYLGDKASESNIKQEASPRVLHIATHGYFFDDIPTDKNNNERFLGIDRQRVVQDPMLRSGLLFTGANKTLQGEKVEGENGLLSASEASLLNLRGTELVILSACETGKGEVKNSEGVYGLRKAFSDAGAANTIMSLWKVDDKVTQEFMTRFYDIWLNEKTTIREAFNRTQLEIKAKYPQPYYWGAFVLVGD
jgi:CHAT domain-containing protein